MERTQASFVEELPRLLGERGISLRQLARHVGVSHTHLSRILREEGYKSVSPELARRVARTLGLDESYFVEAREGFVVQKVRTDAVLRERLFDELSKT